MEKIAAVSCLMHLSLFVVTSAQGGSDKPESVAIIIGGLIGGLIVVCCGIGICVHMAVYCVKKYCYKTKERTAKSLQ